jgi:hypothetical protein
VSSGFVATCRIMSLSTILPTAFWVYSQSIACIFISHSMSETARPFLCHLTSGIAGGLTFAGPSKGPDRKRKNQQQVPHDFVRPRGWPKCFWLNSNGILPQLSNSGSPPAQPGVYPGLIILTGSDKKYMSLVNYRRRNK